MEKLVNFYSWLQENDLPNWVIFSFTAAVWPVVIFLWNKRKVQNISNLEVFLSRANILINQRQYPAFDINFKNNTGSVVYLTLFRLKKSTKNLNITSNADRDISESSYIIKVMDKTSGQYVHSQIVIQTDQTVKTSIALENELPNTFYQFKSNIFRKLFRCNKYFILEYTAMVGDKKYTVSTVY
ncbi:MAG: hypothetical protein ACE5EA_00240 [Nitrospirota bacterium]